MSDGAVQSCESDRFGRHRAPQDHLAWHLLLESSAGQVIGCARYLLHEPTVSLDCLSIYQCPLMQDPIWGTPFSLALQQILDSARKHDIGFAELGGGLDDSHRHPRAALDILLGSYAWGAMIDHCLSICTATARNNSAPILRSMGGTPLKSDACVIPRYWDPYYNCEMEVLAFDSRQAPVRFQPLIAGMRCMVAEAIPVCAGTFEQDYLRLADSVGYRSPTIPKADEKMTPGCRVPIYVLHPHKRSYQPPRNVDFSHGSSCLLRNPSGI